MSRMGDLPAVKAAYPKAKTDILDSYVNDSICGTGERLADAVYHGGSKALTKKGWVAVGTEKYKWAETIPARMNPDINHSPSFCSFRDAVRSL
jgi:hypothetical protein